MFAEIPFQLFATIIELIPKKCGIFTVFLSVIDSELWNRFHSYPWKSMGFGIVSNVGIDFI